MAKARPKTKTWVEYMIIRHSNHSAVAVYEDTIQAKSDKEARAKFKACKSLHKDDSWGKAKLLKKVTTVTELG